MSTETKISPGAGSVASSRPIAWVERNPALATLGAVMVAAAAISLYLGRHFTFIQDTWYFLLERQANTAASFLEPHNEHIVVVPVAIEKLLVGLFGMTSALPERITLMAMLLVTAWLVFVYVRRRIGPWAGVIAATLLLFLGPSWSVLLWPFEIVIVGSVMTGVAMLLLLEREDRRGDLWACLMLTLAVGFSSLGISFLAAAAADVLQRHRRRGWSRIWIAVLPGLLYLAWYAGWGHKAEHHVTLNNVLTAPVYLMNGFASSLDSLLGLSTIDVNDMGQPEWGRPLLIAAIVLIAWGQTKRRGFSSRLWPVLAAAVAYWLLSGFNFFPGRPAVAGRYGYAGAAFVLLIAADLLRGVRIGRAALAVAAGVTVLAVAANLAAFRNGRDWLENVSLLTRADTAGIEIASRTVSPSFTLTPEVAGTGSLQAVNAGQYLSAVAAHGSPAYSPRELAAAPETYRRQADIVIASALPLSAKTEAGAFEEGAARGRGCVAALADGETRIGPGAVRIEVSPGPEAKPSLRRFAQEDFPVKVGSTPGDSVTRLRIPADRAPGYPWYLRVEASQPVWICS